MNNIKETHGIKFLEETTMEELEEKGFLSTRSVFLKFGDNVLLGIKNWKGECVGAVYEIKYIKDEVKGINDTFRKLELQKISKEVFEDTGHAVQWAMKNC